MTGTITEPPKGTDWELVGRVAAPSIKGHGPGIVDDDGFRSCYSRTPIGAVLAASNWTAMGSDPDLAEHLTDRIVAEGPGREAALAKAESEGEGSSSTADDVSIQIAGFRVVSYDGKEANVQLGYTSSYGFNLVYPTYMKWEGGDWKMVLADDGDLITPPYPLETLTGFVRWYGA
ncbi:hypothetical protein [Nocardiopsis rhodophaea]